MSTTTRSPFRIAVACGILLLFSTAVPLSGGTVTRTSSFTYDSKGLLRSETIQPGHPLAVTTTYTRDAQGRITRTTVDPADGPAVTTATHQQLDPSRRYYTRSLNALGHTETREYDRTRGWVTAQTGPNGRRTTYQYDALGRPQRETRPDGTWTHTTRTIDTSQTVVHPQTGHRSISAYKITTSALKAPTTITWYDRLGRPIRTRTQHFDGRHVYQDTGYNPRGQVDCISENYFAGQRAGAHWTRTSYDALGRPVLATAPDGTQVHTQYNGRETIVTRNYQGTDRSNPKANNQVTRTRVNARGEPQTVTTYSPSGQALTLSYRYDGVGNLLQTIDPQGHRTTLSYDIRGHKTRQTDPAMGTWTYRHNAHGQLTRQTDAAGNVTTKHYDPLGRLTRETHAAAAPGTPHRVHHYAYDGSGPFQQLGKLHLEKTLTAGTETYRRSHHYDAHGRPFLTLSNIEGRWFYQSTDYDAYSRPVRLTHYWRPPSLDDSRHDPHPAWYAHTQETHYNDRSYVTEVTDGQGQSWWSSPQYNAHGQLTEYLSGDRLTTRTEYDPATHRVHRIHVQDSRQQPLLDHRYQFDSLGNLTQRQNPLRNLTETITYDRLNRITRTQVGSHAPSATHYDDLGNIRYRSGVGTYRYHPGKPHRLITAGQRQFGYDANGSITTITGPRSGHIQWSAFHQPTHLKIGDQRTLFSYDSTHNRVAQTRQTWDSSRNGGQGGWLNRSRKTTLGSLFEQEQIWDASGSAWTIASTRIYIHTPAGVVGSWVDTTGEAQITKTLFHRDHLGSVIAESKLSPIGPIGIDHEYSYDAWGLARNPHTWHGPATPSAPSIANIATDRGYTGHEMLHSLGLIHMNGRIYDPQLGRMLSADPHIQAPGNLQNHNRYSYVLNNPLSMTDPSGYFFKKLFKSIKKFVKKFVHNIVTAVLAAIPVIGSYLALAYTVYQGYQQGRVLGAVTSIVMAERPLVVIMES